MAKEYGWKDVSVVVLGRTIEGIEDVKVKRKKEKERLMGRGNKALAILTKNEEISGSLKIHQSELNAIDLAIKAVNPLKNITDVAFDVIINYENSDGQAATDAVIGVEVEEYEKALAQGDGKMSIELPFQALELRENI